MSTEQLFGKILQGNETRDAYHQAVIPLILKDDMSPGDWVKLFSGDKTWVVKCSKTDKNTIGFIDPFITADVIPQRSRVYIFLRQGLINDMKHHWTSPYFNPVDIQSQPSRNTTQPVINMSNEQIESEQWLIKICQENNIDFSQISNESVSIVDLEDIASEIAYNNISLGESGIYDLMQEYTKHIEIYCGIKMDSDGLGYIDWSCINC